MLKRLLAFKYVLFSLKIIFMHSGHCCAPWLIRINDYFINSKKWLFAFKKKIDKVHEIIQPQVVYY